MRSSRSDAIGQSAVTGAEARLTRGGSSDPGPECGHDEDRGVATIEADLPRYGSTRVPRVFVGAWMPCKEREVARCHVQPEAVTGLHAIPEVPERHLDLSTVGRGDQHIAAHEHARCSF